MILLTLIAVLFLGGVAAWIAERWGTDKPRWVAIAALAFASLLVLSQFPATDPANFLAIGGSSTWIADLKWQWIPRFGIGFHLAMDGFSLLLVALTILLGFMAVSSSWTEIKHRHGFFFFNLLWTLAGTTGVFLALDLFLFFFFWEVMIIPMYFLIGIFGHEKRTYAAIKFFIFTQVSGLLMLMAMVALVLIHHRNTGVYTFDYFDLLDASIGPKAGFWLMLGFFVAFVVKLPGVPFHTWLPDAHTQAPTGGSVILAGVLLKTGAYGLIRFVVPLFPDASQQFAPVAMSLGVVSVLYAAKVAFAQSDLKRLIAYTSISHMGFILLGVFSWNLLALQGALVTMLAHGISAAALFMVAGSLQERIHTREMGRMGGLWADVPRLSAVALFFSVAALGLPGLGNFIGEFLVLLGAFRVSVPLTFLATLGLILAPIYSLIVIQKAFHGDRTEQHEITDFSLRELSAMGLLMITTAWLGLHPQPVLDVAAPALERDIQDASVSREVNRER